MLDLIAAPAMRPRIRRGGSILKLHASSENVKFQDSPPEAKSQQNPVDPQSGTTTAISNLLQSMAANLPDQSQHGGVRNRADRESDALAMAQAVNLQAAVAHADQIGLPLTRMITIHWERAGLPLAGMANATGRYLDYLTKSLSRHGSKTAWAWVHENGPTKGGHAHMLVHVPADLVPMLTQQQRNWLRRISGRPYRAKVIQSRPIGGRLGVETGNPDLHAINLAEALGYVLKGADAEAQDRLALPRQEPGGRVIGKRCGVSQNVGPKVRLQVGTPRSGCTPAVAAPPQSLKKSRFDQIQIGRWR